MLCGRRVAGWVVAALFMAILAGLLVASCKAVTGCCLEEALVKVPVWDDLLESFLAAVLLFWLPIISSYLFYYQCMALDYVYCCTCVILIIVHALFLHLLLLVIDPFCLWLITCLFEYNINYVCLTTLTLFVTGFEKTRLSHTIINI